MFKSTSNLRGWRFFACVAALPLVLLAVVSWIARPATSASVMVDAFIAARAARDLGTVAALLPANASVVDTANSRAVGGDGWYQLLPLAEVLEVGPRHLENNGDVTWSELVLDDARPSWENNLNWFIDDNAALQATPPFPPAAPSGGRTRTMRATVNATGITHLELGPRDDVGGAGAGAPEVGVLILGALALLLACVVPGAFSSPVVSTGPVLSGLRSWLNEQSSRNSERN